jgi:adenine phosphoribosyltransferase
MEQFIKEKIRSIADFPAPGVVFRDITTLLQDADTLRKTADALHAQCQSLPVSKVVGIDSRGFIFGSMLAERLGAGFVPARKAGKLPYKTVRQSYSLEYGHDSIEMHEDAISPGEKVLVHDDLLATGGTARAACDLVQQLGGEVVQVSFLIELTFLHGRQQLVGLPVASLVQYDSE